MTSDKRKIELLTAYATAQGITLEELGAKIESSIVNDNELGRRTPEEIEALFKKPEETIVEGWVCRNGYDGDIKDSILHLFLKGEPFPDNDRPERIRSIQMWRGANGLHLPSEMFPEVNWESELQRVKITITPM